MLRSLFISVILLPQLIFSQSIPAYTFVLHDSTATGYYFLSTIRLGNSAAITPTQLILDSNGEVVYYNLDKETVDFKLQPDGTISYCQDSKYYILDSTFNVIDSIQCLGYLTDVHDLQVTVNHHYLIMGVKDTIMDLSAFHYFYHNGTPGSPNATVRGHVIQELDSNKNLLWQWDAFDHFLFDDVNPYWLYDPNVVDWTHCNAVELDTDGNILLSTRHFNEITKIDHATGNIIWRMGGKNNQFVFFNEPYQFRGQHDVRRLPNGNITLFDNGRYFVSHGARGIEYWMDELNLTATLAWSYMYDPGMNSIATGGMQRVNGNRSLVNFGSLINHNICFAFVDSLNNMLSELSFVDSSFSYRTFFYPSLLWSFNRPLINCYQQGTDFYLETTVNYSSYLWSTGDTTPSVQITAPGIYYVDVSYGEGMVRSEKFMVTNLLSPCSTTSTEESESVYSFSVSPNPVRSDLRITFNGKNDNSVLKIYDLYGREIYSLPCQIKAKTIIIDTRNWNSGIYFLRSRNYAIKFLKT